MNISALCGRDHFSTFQDGNHGNYEESSFLIEKRLIHGRICASKQIQAKLPPTYSERVDPAVTKDPVSANMSDSNNVMYQDNQKSSIAKVSKISNAKATLLSPVSRRMQTKVPPTYSEKKDPDVTKDPVSINISDSNNVMYQYNQKSSIAKVSKISHHAKATLPPTVSRQMQTKLAPSYSTKEDPDVTMYPVSAKMSDSDSVTYQDNQKTSIGKITTAGHSHLHPFAEELKEEELEKQAHPGAYQVQGLGSTEQHDSFFEKVDIELLTKEVVSEHAQQEPEPLLIAKLVVQPELASASVVDVEAEEKALFQRQVRTAFVIILVIGILVSIIAIPIQLTKTKPTAGPTTAPTKYPTASPTSMLFGILATNTFDDGLALATIGSSQQMWN